MSWRLMPTVNMYSPLQSKSRLWVVSSRTENHSPFQHAECTTEITMRRVQAHPVHRYLNGAAYNSCHANHTWLIKGLNTTPLHLTLCPNHALFHQNMWNWSTCAMHFRPFAMDHRAWKHSSAHKDEFFGDLECLHQISWSSIQLLLRHFTPNQKCHTHSVARIKSRGPKSFGQTVWGSIQNFMPIDNIWTKRPYNHQANQHCHP